MKPMVSALLVLVSLSVFSLWACDVESASALQESAPVRWASLSAAGTPGYDFASGYLKNFSEKQVVAAQVGWVTWTGCLDVTKPRQYDVKLGMLKEVRIPPNDLSSQIGFGVWGDEARVLMNAQPANKPTVVVGIVRVLFADGSEWSLNPNLHADPSFDDDIGFALATMRTCLDQTQLRGWLCRSKQPPKGHEHWAKVWAEMNDGICGTAK